jgi:hypothetical protein
MDKFDWGGEVMRCVVFDPQDMEALTVIEVPQSYIRNLEADKCSQVLRFAVPVPFSFKQWEPSDGLQECPIANVRMERFHYRGVVTWVAIALNPEICLRMRSELLPGQRRDAQERERESFEKGFGKGFLEAIALLS